MWQNNMSHAYCWTSLWSFASTNKGTRRVTPIGVSDCHPYRGIMSQPCRWGLPPEWWLSRSHGPILHRHPLYFKLSIYCSLINHDIGCRMLYTEVDCLSYFEIKKDVLYVCRLSYSTVSDIFCCEFKWVSSFLLLMVFPNLHYIHDLWKHVNLHVFVHFFHLT